MRKVAATILALALATTHGLLEEGGAWTRGVLRRTDESYEGAVSPPRRLFVGAAEKRRKRVRPT